MPSNTWKICKAALSRKDKKDSDSPVTKEIDNPKSFYSVGPTCVTTANIFPVRLGLKKTCDTVSSDVSNIVRECAADYLKYMIAYDTAMISLPREMLDDLMSLLEISFVRDGDDVPLRVFKDIPLMRIVGRLPGLDFYEVRWSYDCKVVRYEDLLIIRFRNKYGIE